VTSRVAVSYAPVMTGRLRRYARGVFRVVATGTWVYGQDVPVTVRLVESDRDFWFDITEADSNLEDDEQPRLSEDGLCCYVCFHEGWDRESPSGRIPLASSASTKRGPKPRRECPQPSTGNRPDAQPLAGATTCSQQTGACHDAPSAA
jgi:hypothetical protein